MGCWLKEYRDGYRWYCNTSGKFVSPTMTWEVALLANVLGEREEFVLFSPSDARMVRNWKNAKKKAEKVLPQLSKEEYERQIGNFYGEVYKSKDAWKK
jgi:hypothetical protein